MEIAFQSLSLRSVCVSEAKSIGLYGVDVAQSLKRRLADLRAADSIDELSAWNIAEVPGSGGAAMSLELAGGYRLIFRANHSKMPMEADRKPSWSNIMRVKLMKIEKIK
jgi:plasmid maintenance system killer protein